MPYQRLLNDKIREHYKKNTYETTELFLVSLMVVSCITPGPRRLSKKKIKKLTTCYKTSIKKIRRNLLLAGFKTSKYKRNLLVTKYKQVDGYADDKELQRYTVLRIGKGKYRFSVRVKRVSTDVYQDKSKSFSLGDISFGDTGKKKTRKKESSDDLEYWSNRIDEYKEMQEDVCG